MKKILTCIYILFAIMYGSAYSYAQEHRGPLLYNGAEVHAVKKLGPVSRTTSLSLPFFDDFTNYDGVPDNSKWVEQQTYVNNTMCISPISRGVVTFDALSQYGIPYDTLSNTDPRYCDSLTSQPINLSTYAPSDSLYLSFFYQAGGYGFLPTINDSLLLYVRKKNTDWVKIWSKAGDTLAPFRCVMIPVTDTNYLYGDFQFRFVNIAAVGYSDAVWNVDYVKFAANRGIYDTIMNDIGYTSDPSFLLNDYTYMPYRQFMVNTTGELASQLNDSIQNNYRVGQTVSFGYVANETTTNTPLYTSGTGTVSLYPFLQQPVSLPTYTTTVPLTDPYAKVVFENKFYMQTPAGDPVQNDTIVKEQVFDNYLAYDDGTAELSYYLTQFYSLPAKLAIEYHLNQPDTLRGLAIYFGRQVPIARYKNFSIAVYKALEGINGATADTLLAQDDDYLPGYVDTVNHFWVYSLSQPLPLPAGTFYMGTIQPAYGISDSLYFGLDANRLTTNHAYFNVQAQWLPSQIPGAIMIRPLLGQPVQGTAVKQVNKIAWSIAPNPAHDLIRFNYTGFANAAYQLSDMAGRSIMQGSVSDGQELNVTGLSPGMYFIRLIVNGVPTAPQKIIKQ